MVKICVGNPVIYKQSSARDAETSSFHPIRGMRMRIKGDIDGRKLLESVVVAAYDKREDLRRRAKEQIVKIENENWKEFIRHRTWALIYKEGDLSAIKQIEIGAELKFH
ncbi:hypothetical protein KM043_008060 [Ampulex compressa]|nr:hypothetical protein KM043_008060 [Ampulex compressa]